MQRLEIARTLGQMSDLTAKWARLHSESGSGDPFLLPWWYLPLHRHSPWADGIRLVEVSEGDDLVAILPLRVETTWKLGFRAWVASHALAGIADSEQFLFRDNGAEFMASALGALHEQEPWDVLELREVPAKSRLFSLFRHLPEAGFSVMVFPGSVCPYLSLESREDNFWRRIYRDGKRRSKRKALFNRLASFPGASFATESEYVDGGHFFRDVAAVEKTSWKKEKNGSLTCAQWRTLFFQDAFSALHKAGALQADVVAIDQVPAAFAVSFRSNRRLLFYQTSYDPAYARLSPGYAATMSMIRRGWESGMLEIDMGRGIHGYKNELTSHARRNYEVLVFRRRRAASAYAQVRRARRLLRTILRPRRAGPSWSGHIEEQDEAWS